MSGNLAPNADERSTLPTNPAAVQSCQDGTNKSAAQDAINQTAAQPANDSGLAVNDDPFQTNASLPGFGREKKNKTARRAVAPVASSVERLSADNEQEELEGTAEPAYDAPNYQTISKACRQEFALCDDALYGLAGRIVKKLDPETESHPAAILIEILIGFGSIIGPHCTLCC